MIPLIQSRFCRTWMFTDDARCHAMNNASNAGMARIRRHCNLSAAEVANAVATSSSLHEVYIARDYRGAGKEVQQAIGFPLALMPISDLGSGERRWGARVETKAQTDRQTVGATDGLAANCVIRGRVINVLAFRGRSLDVMSPAAYNNTDGQNSAHRLVIARAAERQQFAEETSFLPLLLYSVWMLNAEVVIATCGVTIDTTST